MLLQDKTSPIINQQQLVYQTNVIGINLLLITNKQTAYVVRTTLYSDFES